MSFNLITIINEYKEFECIVCFLMGLGGIYGIVETQIFVIEPHPLSIESSLFYNKKGN